MRSSLVTAALVAGFALVGCGKHKAADPAAPAVQAVAASARRVPIEVRKTGYVPNTLEAEAKEELVLVFTRVDDTDCGRFIKVQGTDIKTELPMNQPVEIHVTMPESGELIFTCGMDMMHGVIAVNPARG